MPINTIGELRVAARKGLGGVRREARGIGSKGRLEGEPRRRASKGSLERESQRRVCRGISKRNLKGSLIVPGVIGTDMPTGVAAAATGVSSRAIDAN
jgi:hypothetical protein